LVPIPHRGMPWTFEGSQILHWGETGPNAAGVAETSYTFAVDTKETRFVCALARLSFNRKEDTTRRSLALFDARAAATGSKEKTGEPSKAGSGEQKATASSQE